MSQKEPFKLSIQSIISIGYLLIILIGHLYLSQFYSAFKINIVDYLNPLEYIFPILPFFSVLVFTGLTFLLWLLGQGLLREIHEHKNKNSSADNSEENTKSDYKNNKALRTIALVLDNIIFLLFPIAVLISIFLNEESRLILVVVCLVTFFLSMMFVVLIQKHFLTTLPNKVRYISGAIMFLMLIIFIFYIENKRRIEKIKEGKEPSEITFKGKSVTIMTNDTIQYLGQSREFIFFYDSKNKVSKVIDKKSENILTIQ